MATPSQRSAVLSLYRRALRVARDWENVSERDYIRNEARSMAETPSRQPEHYQSQEAVQRALSDAEKRLALVVHYKIPYPRPHNVPPGQSGVGLRPATPVPQH